jgi:nucleoside-diphosphate-sugar epimerase
MIMITGGGGFVGLNIAHSLVKKGQDVLLVQRHAVPRHPLLAPYWDKQVKQAAGNVLDWPFLSGLVKQYPIASVVHGAFDTAAIVRPELLKSGLRQLVQVELEGSRNLLEITRIAGLRRLTFISSVDCYRGWPDECEVWHEDAYLPPVSFSPIGNCKRAVEQMGFLYSKTYGLSFVALRVGRVYGPGASNPQPIRSMIESAAAGRAIDLSGVPGGTRGHTVYAKDVGEAASLIHLAQSLRHYIYNVSDGTNPTMLEIARTIQELVPNAEITLGPAAQEISPHRSVDVKRINDEFGFVFCDLKTGIGDYVAWLNRQSAGGIDADEECDRDQQRTL